MKFTYTLNPILIFKRLRKHGRRLMIGTFMNNKYSDKQNSKSALIWLTSNLSQNEFHYLIKFTRKNLNKVKKVDVVFPEKISPTKHRYLGNKLTFIEPLHMKYTNIFLDTSRLYKSGYAIDIVRECISQLDHDGFIWFQSKIRNIEDSSPLINYNWIFNVFGSDQDCESSCGNFLGWRKKSWIAKDASIFPIARRILRNNTDSSNHSADLSKRNISYEVNGLMYKSTAISYFIKSFIKDSSYLNILSVGGGFGLTELNLLASDPRISSVTNIEPDLSVLNFNKSLVHQIRDELNISEQKKYLHITVSAEGYSFNQQKYDVIMALGSLLFINKKFLNKFLDSCWKSLNKGGLLVLHENIKSKKYKSKEYYSNMFTEYELDLLLSQFGPIRYFSSHAFREINAKDTKDLTLFRVLEKTKS